MDHLSAYSIKQNIVTVSVYNGMSYVSFSYYTDAAQLSFSKNRIIVNVLGTEIHIYPDSCSSIDIDNRVYTVRALLSICSLLL